MFNDGIIQELDVNSFFKIVNDSCYYVSHETNRKRNNEKFFLTLDIETNKIYDELNDCFYVDISTLQIGYENYFIKTQIKSEMKEILNRISELHHAIVYVHNLQYEFFFLHDYLKGDIEKHFIIKGKIANFTWKGVKFKCSLFLIRLSLQNAIKEYAPEYKKGDEFDYAKIRTEKTLLSDLDVMYIGYDVCSLHAVIRNIAELNNYLIKDLPITFTGFTRKRMSKKLSSGFYLNNINKMKLPTKLYLLSKDSYVGGVADVNPQKMNKIIDNVIDFDICSEYTTSQVLFKFPTSTPKEEKVEFKELVKTVENVDRSKGFITKVKFKNLKVKSKYVIPILIKYNLNDEQVKLIKSGGRIYGADVFTGVFNCVDFSIFLKMYDFDDVEVLETWTFKMNFLPKPFVNMVLEQYLQKTKYKDIEEKEVSYKLSKTDLNSYYGITAMKLDFEEYFLNGDDMIERDNSLKTIEDLEITVGEHNEKKKRNYFHLWGQYTSSWGHYQLYKGIEIVGRDLIGTDTDSIKSVYRKKYVEQIEELNEIIKMRCVYVAKYHNIDIEKFSPKTNKGVEKWLGVWEADNYDNEKGKLLSIIYKRPKCYLKVFEHGYKFVVAGISASRIEAYYKERVDKGKNKSVEECFINNVEIPKGKSGKLTHKYVKEQETGFKYYDDEGNEGNIDITTGIILDEASFNLDVKTIHELVYEYLKCDSFDLIG